MSHQVRVYAGEALEEVVATKLREANLPHVVSNDGYIFFEQDGPTINEAIWNAQIRLEQLGMGALAASGITPE